MMQICKWYFIGIAVCTQKSKNNKPQPFEGGVEGEAWNLPKLLLEWEAKQPHLKTFHYQRITYNGSYIAKEPMEQTLPRG